MKASIANIRMLKALEDIQARITKVEENQNAILEYLKPNQKAAKPSKVKEEVIVPKEEIEEFEEEFEEEVQGE